MHTKQLPRTIIDPSHGYSVTFVVSGAENNNAYTMSKSPYLREKARTNITNGLGDDGLLKPNGMPKSILHLSIIYEIGESYLPDVPLWLQKDLFSIIAKVARLKGKDKGLEKYYTGVLEDYNTRSSAELKV